MKKTSFKKTYLQPASNSFGLSISAIAIDTKSNLETGCTSDYLVVKYNIIKLVPSI